ncbi:MAG: bile acid:sodium symporter family protein [Candidatus Aminicenantes bacterium]|nr:bile acid:sodium symporter family protein [Candidatus Aminicenantes bacterium]
MNTDEPRGHGFRRFYKNYAFTLWVLFAVTASMCYPAAFRSWFGTDLKVLIVPLIQVITFGMGTTLSAKDFRNVLTMPGPVFIGISLQFMIMPFVGFTIAMTFGFPPEVAAGVILIGSVSSGVASNVMTYLAGGNVPLSVTITASTTLLSPVVTPFWMKTLAGRLVPVDFVAMMLSIFNMIIIPIVAGLAANRLLYGTKKRTSPAVMLAISAPVFLALAAAAAATPTRWWGALAVLKHGVLLGFLLLGITALAKLVIAIILKGPANWMDKTLPVVSMAGICLIIAIITTQSRDQLLSVGPLLILAAIVHNGTGYGLGYAGGRLARLDESACRAVAMEVGMQNGGMASGIAIDVLKSTSAALAPAIFGPWMNVSGSLLAGWWRRRPVRLKKSL